MSRSHAAQAETAPPFNMSDKGGVTSNWKTILTVAAFIFAAGGAYFKLQDHDRRLDKIEGKVDDLKQIATEIKMRLPSP